MEVDMDKAGEIMGQCGELVRRARWRNEDSLSLTYDWRSNVAEADITEEIASDMKRVTRPVHPWRATYLGIEQFAETAERAAASLLHVLRVNIRDELDERLKKCEDEGNRLRDLQADILKVLG